MVSLKALDLFPKIQAESQRTTAQGGWISLVGLTLALVLVATETVQLSAVSVIERLELFEERFARDLTVYLDVDFFHLDCEELAFDFSSRTNSEQTERSVGWTLRSLETKPAFDGDGCQVRAVVDVEGYQSGEMHVALSPHALPNGQMGITIEDYFQYNASHQIKRFAIGDKLRPAEEYPASSFELKTVPEQGTGRYLYDFNVVPQTYRTRNDEEKLTFPVQCREQDVITTNDNEAIFALQTLGLPGVFMFVHLSTMMVVKVEVMTTWGAYFIEILGIVAGTSAIVAFVDSLLHEAFWKDKLD